MTAVVVLVITLFDVNLMTFNWPTSSRIQGENGNQTSHVAETGQQFVTQNYNIFVLLALPLLALTTRRLFRTARLNLAEHFVFGFYVLGHLSLVRAVIAPFFGFGDTVRVVYMVLQLGYFSWAAKVFFRVSWWAAGWRSLVAIVTISIFIMLVALFGAITVVVLPG